MRKEKIDLHFLWLIFVTIVVTILIYEIGWAKEARTVRLNDKQVAKIFVNVGRTTILNFPTKPTKVILGNRAHFAIEYVENDLAISSLSPGARSNLFVYLPSRRFAFDLTSSPKGSDEIVLIRDAPDQQSKANVK